MYTKHLIVAICVTGAMLVGAGINHHFFNPRVNPATNEQIVESNVAEAEPLVEIDKFADLVCVSTQEVPMYAEPDSSARLIGTLPSGTAISVSPVNPQWGVAGEYKAYCELDKFEKTPTEKIVGVLFTRNELDAICYKQPAEDDKPIQLDKYNTYEIIPLIYNGNFYCIGNSAYIEKRFAKVDYYPRSYYYEHIKPFLNSGKIEHYRVNLIPPVYPLSNVITERCGLNADELESIVAGTGLEGLGHVFYEMESAHGVNAVFALAVAQLESGHGTSSMALNDNNLFGVMGLSYSSKEENIDAFGRLISGSYFACGLDTVSSINPVYCPDNYNWAPQVRSLMERDFAKVSR